MKVVNHSRFTHKAVFLNRVYYFFDDVNVVNGNVVISCSSYTRGRFAKWREDKVTMTDLVFARKLFAFAHQKGLITEIPAVLK